MSVRPNSGFTLVEVLISIVILTVGMLAMATSSIVTSTQIRLADIETEQSFAVQHVVEQLRSIPFENITTRSESDARRLGSFDVWWTVESRNRYLKRATIFTKGPGYAPRSGWLPVVRDTFVTEIAAPFPD